MSSYADNFLKILGKYGDTEKLNSIRDMVMLVTEEVESTILTKAEKSPLDPDEIAFLRRVRVSKRVQISNTRPMVKSVRFAPYETNFEKAVLDPKSKTMSPVEPHVIEYDPSQSEYSCLSTKLSQLTIN